MVDHPPDQQTHRVGFSILENGFVGIQFDTPFASSVTGWSVEAAEVLAENFTTQLREVIALAKRRNSRNSGLVVATDDTLHVLKGNK